MTLRGEQNIKHVAAFVNCLEILSRAAIAAFLFEEILVFNKLSSLLSLGDFFSRSSLTSEVISKGYK